MKSMITRRNTTSLIRITLSFLIVYLQLLLPFTDIFAAINSAEPGVVSTPENQESSQPLELPFIPGDAIFISTYPDSSSFLNGIYPIDDQGYIEFPIGDRVNISNMSEENFLNHLKENYKNYMRSPNLFVRPLIRVMVAGGFTTPGLYYVEKNISFWDLIRMAGGPNHEGAIKEINWERNGEKVIEDVSPFLEHGVSLNSMGVQSGDLVWAPSVDAEDTWEFLVVRVLPIATFATSIYLIWISYQTMILIATGR
jgi:protein involved in polysaccharide export with SLBB domain